MITRSPKFLVLVRLEWEWQGDIHSTCPLWEKPHAAVPLTPKCNAKFSCKFCIKNRKNSLPTLCHWGKLTGLNFAQILHGLRASRCTKCHVLQQNKQANFMSLGAHHILLCMGSLQNDPMKSQFYQLAVKAVHNNDHKQNKSLNTTYFSTPFQDRWQNGWWPCTRHDRILYICTSETLQQICFL